jgi:MFS family permease
MIHDKKVITGSSFLCMFFMGVGTTVVGAAARNIGLTPYQIGLLLAVQNVGFIISVSLFGALSDTYEKPRLLFLSSLVLAISFALFYIRTSFLLNLLVMFFIGLGMGGYEGIADAMLLDIHEEKESLYILVNHFFVTFGSLMITLYLLFLQMNWRRSMVQSSIVVGCLVCLFAITRLEKGKTQSGSRQNLLERLRAIKSGRLVFTLLLAASCIVGVELGTIGILTTFLMQMRAFSQVTSKLGLIIFLSGEAVGRLFVGLFTKKHHLLRIMLLLLGLSTALFTVLYFLDTNGRLVSTAVLVFLSGITISAIFPIILSIAGLSHKEMAGTALGIIKMGIPIGGILIPLILSVISRYISFKVSLLLFPFFVLVCFMTILINRKKLMAFNFDKTVGL